jgi:uncharacterized phiE125 gp8 family phage protein
MLAPIRTIAPVNPLLTIEEVKAHLHVDHSDDDAMISGFVDAASSHVDGYAGIVGRALVTQTWAVDFPAFSNRMDIPLGPLQSATVGYYDSLNVLQTLSSSVYAVLSDALGPYVSLKYDQQWPPTYTREDAVRITWVAGYGANAAAVPAAIRQAMLLMIGGWYQNRESVAVGMSVEKLPFAVEALLSPFRRVGI